VRPVHTPVDRASQMDGLAAGAVRVTPRHVDAVTVPGSDGDRNVAGAETILAHDSRRQRETRGDKAAGRYVAKILKCSKGTGTNGPDVVAYNHDPRCAAPVVDECRLDRTVPVCSHNVREKGSLVRRATIGTPDPAVLRIPPYSQLLCPGTPLSLELNMRVMSPVGKPAPILLGTMNASDHVLPLLWET